MYVGSWNISKLSNPRAWQCVKLILPTVDLMVILEASGNKAAAEVQAANLLQGLNGWNSQVVLTPATGGEAESMIILHRDGVVVRDCNTVTLNDASIRPPVRFRAGMSGEGTRSYDIVAWHAPTNGVASSGITYILGKIGSDVLIGDMNTGGYGERENYDCLIRVPTTLTKNLANEVPDAESFNAKAFCSNSFFDKIYTKKTIERQEVRATEPQVFRGNERPIR
jgi:hypothetical protein